MGKDMGTGFIPPHVECDDPAVVGNVWFASARKPVTCSTSRPVQSHCALQHNQRKDAP